ncbi:helix-turn-helix domain-containing protein [Streptomyces sp. NPDC054784]
MPAHKDREVGRRIAVARRLARMTQQELADSSAVSYGTVRAVERGARVPSDEVLEELGAALGVDPSRLRGGQGASDSRIRSILPAVSATIAAYDAPSDGSVRSEGELRAAVTEMVTWRLGSQYLRVAREAPSLLAELLRALHGAGGQERRERARLLTNALRSADAVAYKTGQLDLSARLIELMRWASAFTEDPLLDASVAYVRGEVFLAARAHEAGLRVLEAAIDRAPAPHDVSAAAARGALHMRAAVVAGRAGDPEGADVHLAEARRLGDPLPEDIYGGTAFGASSVRIHEVSVAVALGGQHLSRALDIAAEWSPPRGLPAERRSSFYIELGRAQLWSGLRDDAFESLKVARRTAPQHTRDHRWVREDIATLRRLKRGHCEELSNFAEWCHAI